MSWKIRMMITLRRVAPSGAALYGRAREQGDQVLDRKRESASGRDLFNARSENLAYCQSTCHASRPDD